MDFKNKEGEVQVVNMPRIIKKVPNQLPPEITSLQSMFIFCETFNQDISSWNTSHVKNMNYLFHGAISFNQNISNWNVSNVTDMSGMFRNVLKFNQNISNLNVSSVMKYQGFSFDSGIDNSNKLPKFKEFLII